MNKRLLVFQWVVLLIVTVLVFAGCPTDPESETEPGPLTISGQVYTEAGAAYTGATNVYAFYADPPGVANHFASGTISASGQLSITLPFPVSDTMLIPGKHRNIYQESANRR